MGYQKYKKEREANSSVLSRGKSQGRRASEGGLPFKFHVPEKIVISRVEENSDALETRTDVSAKGELRKEKGK